MGKIIKFPGSDDSNQNKKPVNNEPNFKKVNSENVEKDMKTLVEEAVTDYLLTNFAIKEILELHIYHKTNKNDVGVYGIVIYEHKRRPGIFSANFVGKGHISPKDKSVKIDIAAFEAGEKDLYMSTLKTLKAKNILPIDLK